jgi:hypothetical protein
LGVLSLIEFAAVCVELGEEIKHSERKGIETAAKIVEAEAKRVLGTYDYGWTRLKPQTVAQKANGDTPLLETGDMRGFNFASGPQRPRGASRLK